MRDEIAPGASVSTVKRAPKAENIWKWRAKKRAMLTPAHVAEHLAWAQKYKNYTLEDWEAVLFSDECSVEKIRDPCTDWVLRSTTETAYAVSPRDQV